MPREDEQEVSEKNGFSVEVAGIRQRNLRKDDSDEGDENDNQSPQMTVDSEESEEMEEAGDMKMGKNQTAPISGPSPKDYYMWDQPLSSMQVTVASFENNPHVRNHIIVCGIHSSIKNFIVPLRIKYLKEFQI